MDIFHKDIFGHLVLNCIRVVSKDYLMLDPCVECVWVFGHSLTNGVQLILEGLFDFISIVGISEPSFHG